MARVKQMARKSTRGAPPHLHLATMAAQAAAQKAIAVRKPHRWHPGTVALREIQKFQKTTDFLIRKAPFQHLVREIIHNMSRKSNLQMQSTALLALQEAAEYFMVDVLSNTKVGGGTRQACHHQGQGSGSSFLHPRDRNAKSLGNVNE
jgi:histone H3